MSAVCVSDVHNKLERGLAVWAETCLCSVSIEWSKEHRQSKNIGRIESNATKTISRDRPSKSCKSTCRKFWENLDSLHTAPKQIQKATIYFFNFEALTTGPRNVLNSKAERSKNRRNSRDCRQSRCKLMCCKFRLIVNCDDEREIDANVFLICKLFSDYWSTFVDCKTDLFIAFSRRKDAFPKILAHLKLQATQGEQNRNRVPQTRKYYGDCKQNRWKFHMSIDI